MSRAAARPLARAGPVPRGARPPARRCSSTATERPPAAARAPARVHARRARPTSSQRARAARRASAPSSSRADRGGDITYHGPGQLVGYPILTARQTALGAARQRRLRAHVEQLSSTRSPTSGSTAGGCDGYPGVWVDATDRPRKIARHRRAPQARPHDARLRPQRRPRPRACASTSCRAASRDRPVTSLAEEGVDVIDARGRRASSPGSRRAVGRRCGRAPGRRVARTRPTTCRLHRVHASAPASGGAGDVPVRLARPPGRGRRRRRAADRAPASRSGCGRRLTSAPRYRALKRTCASLELRHGVRGGRLPEHLRVLGRRHRDVHDPRRALHAGVRVLPRRHPPARSRSTPTSRSASPRRSRNGPRPTPSSRSSPATTWPTAARPRSRPRSRAIRAAQPAHRGRDADLRLQGRRRRARRCSSTPAPTC